MKRALGIGSLGLAALALAGLHPSARADIPPRPREVIAKPAAPSASAAPAASAGSAAPVATTPAPPKEVVAVKDYAWPTDESPEPSEEDWAGATDLGSRSLTFAACRGRGAARSCVGSTPSARGYASCARQSNRSAIPSSSASYGAAPASSRASKRAS